MLKQMYINNTFIKKIVLSRIASQTHNYILFISIFMHVYYRVNVFTCMYNITKLYCLC